VISYALPEIAIFVLFVYFGVLIVIKCCYCFPKALQCTWYSSAAWIPPIVSRGGGTCEHSTRVRIAAPSSPTSSWLVGCVVVLEGLKLA
jgi:hypothetical protein